MANLIKASQFLKLPQEHRELFLNSGVVPVNDIFYPYFGNREKIVLPHGSYGSGKSKFTAQDLVEKCRTDKKFKCYYGRKIKDTVRISNFDELATDIEDRGLENEFSYSRADNSSMVITHKKTGNKFIPFGTDNAKSLKSIKDPTHIWCEEFDQFTESDFGFLFSRLRLKGVSLQFYGTFNTEPLIEGHWLREQFFDNKEEYEITPLKIFCTYKDNYFIDQDDYLNKLKLIARGREHVLKAIAEGKFGVTINKNPFFYAYRHGEHYTPERYRLYENELIYLSFDFNANPTTLLIGMVHDKEIAIIDLIMANEDGDFIEKDNRAEIKGLSPLETCCDIFYEKYISSGLINPAYIIVTGDASGKQKGADKVKNKHFYKKIETKLGISESQVKKRLANIEHKLSSEICNSLMYNCDFKIYKSAYLLTQDLNNAYADEKGTLNTAKADPKFNGFHIADAFRYFCDCILDFNNWQDWIRYYSTQAA